ncbi:MAG: signal peptidase I [Bacilli bacterium]|jgi:signal peptidase I|nr:signal peptidase I [Bacilli bacterium]MDD3389458.1 signal peptidase I [Bacilli bacterium]MDD4344331.1 signal peptidase I [Bacilli bacterium]MDD4520961.1 signal peptidase I [Bacilli bacterium]MDY0399786.1 signal peptidase I [Bacilli bacterium]
MQEAIVGHSTPPSKNPKLAKHARWQRVFSFVISFLIITTLIFGLGILGVNNYYTSVWISGESMLPTLQNLEFGLMNTHEYRINQIERYQIIIIDAARALDSGSSTSRIIIKRVIGLPNETIHIEDGMTSTSPDSITITNANSTFTLDDQPINPVDNNIYPFENTYIADKYACGHDYTLTDDQYFVLGDNRARSTDSRFFGYIDKSEIIGVLFLIEGRYQLSEYIGGEEVPKNRNFYAPWDFRYYY